MTSSVASQARITGSSRLAAAPNAPYVSFSFERAASQNASEGFT